MTRDYDDDDQMPFSETLTDSSCRILNKDSPTDKMLEPESHHKTQTQSIRQRCARKETQISVSLMHTVSDCHTLTKITVVSWSSGAADDTATRTHTRCTCMHAACSSGVGPNLWNFVVSRHAINVPSHHRVRHRCIDLTRPRLTTTTHHHHRSPSANETHWLLTELSGI
jgi:hypothetical protein